MRIDRTVRHATCVLAALLLAGSLAACGSGGGSSDSAGLPAQPAPQRETTGGGTGDRGSGGSQNRPGAPEPAAPARSVVYTAQLRVRVADTDQAAAKAKQQTLAAGGYVQSESSMAGLGSTVALKIPSDRYPAVLDGLGRLGTRLSLSQNAEDVSREVADVDSRVRSARATVESFRKLLDRAGSVQEIINVEEEISQRQAELEALQARQKALQHSTRYATVTLTLTAPSKAEAPKDEGKDGFFGGLENGWAAFTAFLSGAALVVGWLLPFLGLALIIGLPVAMVWWRMRGRKVTSRPPE